MLLAASGASSRLARASRDAVRRSSNAAYETSTNPSNCIIGEPTPSD